MLADKVGKTSLYRLVERFIDMVVCPNSNVDMIGGKVVVVQVDECKLITRKYHTGRVLKNVGYWVFGGIESGEGTDKNWFEVVVQTRDFETLNTIIQSHIKIGTIIHSDICKGYNRVEYIPYKKYIHKTVNHSYNFVDPDTGVHTQEIEGKW